MSLTARLNEYLANAQIKYLLRLSQTQSRFQPPHFLSTHSRSFSLLPLAIFLLPPFQLPIFFFLATADANSYISYICLTHHTH